MKNYILIFLLLTISILNGQTVFKHTAVAANISNNWTILDDAATNNNPNALLQVTSDYGPNGPYHNKSIGVWYTNGKWTIFNQDRSPMTVNAKFNVMVSAPSANVFMYTSTQTVGHIAMIDHPRLNNNPNAKFLVTQNWGGAGPYNNNPIGVYYTGNKWAVYNQNYFAMPASAKFNIIIDDAIFVVTANPPQGNYYFFDNPSTTDRAGAFVFATQYWMGVYNANEIGVWYSGNKWSVYNQSRNPLPSNAKFMVWGYTPTFIVPPFDFPIIRSNIVTVYEQPNNQGRSVGFRQNTNTPNVPFTVRSIQVTTGNIAELEYNCSNDFPPTEGFTGNNSDVTLVGGICKIKIIPILGTQTVNIPDFTERCPTRNYRGDQDLVHDSGGGSFGGDGPKLFCRTNLTLEGNLVRLNVFFSAEEFRTNGSAVDGSWPQTIFTAPSGQRPYLTKMLSNQLQYVGQARFQSRKAGPEVGIFGACNEGEVHTSGTHFQLEGQLARQMVIVGDTGGKDINSNCGCDTKIKRISFNPVTVYSVANN
jgi:hypothetical protein